jgi:hypothetical protein
VPGLEGGIAYSLYIDNGMLTGLEAGTYDEEWPESWPAGIPSFQLEYRGDGLLDKYAKEPRDDELA